MMFVPCVARALEFDDYKVIEAADGLEALRVVQEWDGSATEERRARAREALQAATAMRARIGTLQNRVDLVAVALELQRLTKNPPSLDSQLT
jgi:hypothetical protein